MIRAALLTVTLAMPAAAQSFEEAVRANVALGVRLCAVEAGGNFALWTSRFRAAGFAERVEQSGGMTIHRFTAPAGTARVDLSYGQLPAECRVHSDHLGVTGASALLDEIAPGLYPTYRRVETGGAPDPATGRPALCVRYEDPSSPIPHTIGAWPGGQAQGCVENGTSVISSFSAV